MRKTTFTLFVFISLIISMQGTSATVDEDIANCKKDCFKEKKDGFFDSMRNNDEVNAWCYKECCNDFRPLAHDELFLKNAVRECAIGAYGCVYKFDGLWRSTPLINARCYELCEDKYELLNYWGETQCKYDIKLQETIDQYHDLLTIATAYQ